MKIPENSWPGIYKYLGDETDGFIDRVEKRIEKLKKAWQLSDFTFMPTDTINLLYSCESALYGTCVLKMCIPGPEVATEINCLRAYDNKGYCKLYAYDLEDDALLLEKVKPGNQMWDVKNYKERARLMGTVINELSFINDAKEQYPTYLSWMKGIHETLTKMTGLDDVLDYLNKAIEIYKELKSRHSKSCLLHGDLHQENMLLNSSGSYTIIDPKGVIDDPVMETARFLMNETPDDPTPDDAKKIKEMVAIMSPMINISEPDILKSMYIDAALSNSWTMEGHYASKEAFEKVKQSVLKTCNFVYKLI